MFRTDRQDMNFGAQLTLQHQLLASELPRSGERKTRRARSWYAPVLALLLAIPGLAVAQSTSKQQAPTAACLGLCCDAVPYNANTLSCMMYMPPVCQPDDPACELSWRVPLYA